MSEVKTAIVLGGTVPHCELIKQLKDRGYYTILVDYLDEPPAKKYADLHIQESTLDKETVYNIAIKYNAKLVIATNIDHANSTACYVLEKLGLHSPYSFQTSVDMTDKQRMKSILKKHGIPTADFQIVSSENDMIDIGFPSVVKPVDSNGSRGVCLVENKAQLKEAVKNALTASKTGRAIVEAYIGGREASVYTYVNKGKAHIILSNLRCVIEDRTTGTMPGVSMLYPCPFTTSQLKKVEEICQASAEAFELENTPLLLQIKFENDNVYVIELMPRIGGGQSYLNIKELTHFDMISAAIDSFEGKEIKLNYSKPDCLTLTNHLYCKTGIFGCIQNIETIQKSGLVQEITQLKASGVRIDADLSSGNRICSFVVKGKNVEEIVHKTSEVMSEIDILDVNGKSILAREMIPDNPWVDFMKE